MASVIRRSHTHGADRSRCPACLECGGADCRMCAAAHRLHDFTPSIWQYVCGQCGADKFASIHRQSEDPCD